MIHDLLIIKDGLPLLSKNFSNSSNVFSQSDTLLLVSGFFTALNSFSDSFDDLGSISELKLSKNDLKLSFLKDISIPNLIYLATFDENSKSINVRRTLRKVSRTFLQKYNINEILNWKGKRDTFQSFEKVLDYYIEEEMLESDTKFKERVEDLFKCVEEKINEETSLKALKGQIKQEDDLPHYCSQIPAFTTSKKINPKIFLTGETSHKVFYKINGKRSIKEITNELKLNHDQVYNICKNLIKLGFVNLS